MSKTKDILEFKNLKSLTDYFNTEDKCIGYLKELFWGGDLPPACLKCGCESKLYQRETGNIKCHECHAEFNVLTDTFFENTKLSLIKWFMAIYLASTNKRGISSTNLAKIIGTTQKTAWFMLQRLRRAYSKLAPEILEGEACCDETFIGGKSRNRHYHLRPKSLGYDKYPKTFVFGLMAGGKVRTFVIPAIKSNYISPIIHKYIKRGSVLTTDSGSGYVGLQHRYKHFVNDHNKYEYSNQGHSTNPIENYWSHLKRSIIGVYYLISKKHTERYLSEFDFKFNTRNETSASRFNLVLKNCENTRLTYKNLTA